MDVELTGFLEASLDDSRSICHDRSSNIRTTNTTSQEERRTLTLEIQKLSVSFSV
jgi:hypothetical protein